MRTGLALFTLALVATAAACSSGSSSGTCASTRDCPLGEACVSGSCTPVSSKKCTSDQDCNFEEACIDSKCVANPPPTNCTDDSMCSATERCNTLTGVCIERGAACADESECTGGLHCDVAGQQCVACLDGSHCAANEICSAGACTPNMTGSCTTDPECNPPNEICMAGGCVLGCGQPNGAVCSDGDVCDTNTGRCVSIRGPCSADPDCNPPTEVCEYGQCIPGCTEFGGVQCPGGQQCNPSTGRCTAVGDICLSDLDCMMPSEICNLVSGGCDPGCATSGCTSPDTCDQTSGHCTGSRMCAPDRFEPNDTFAQGSAGSGLLPQLTVCPGDVDFHKFTMNAGDPVAISVEYVYGEGNIDIELVNASGSVVAMSRTTGNESIMYTAAAAGEYAVRVFLDRDLGPTPGNTYSINIAVTMAPCPDDSFEDNDEPLFAPLINTGTTNGLNVCDGDDDYFNIFLEPGEQLTVNARFLHAEGDIDLAVVNLLGIPLATSVSEDDDESVTHTQGENSGFVKVLVTLYQDSGSMPGNPYTLEINIGGGTPQPPQQCTADSFEPNDAMGSAPAVGMGTYQGLHQCGDDDWFGIALTAGETINIDVSFTHAEGDIDIELYGPSGRRALLSNSTTNDENIAATVNVTGTFNLRVLLYEDTGSTPGNSYDLSLSP